MNWGQPVSEWPTHTSPISLGRRPEIVLGKQKKASGWDRPLRDGAHVRFRTLRSPALGRLRVVELIHAARRRLVRIGIHERGASAVLGRRP